MSELEAIEIGPREGVVASVIWLHGLGADGHDFEPIVPELGLPETVRFVFPHAPVRPVTVNGGMSMRAWYDIYGVGAGFDEDEAGTRDSEARVIRLIERESELGVASERIVVAGFSQGGAIALHTALRYPHRLAGVMALSTYVPLRRLLEAERHQANQQTPIFMAHGRHDAVVPFDYGRLSKDLLESLGYAVEWHDYPMEHSVSLEEVQDISAWLRRVLALG